MDLTIGEKLDIVFLEDLDAEVVGDYDAFFHNFLKDEHYRVEIAGLDEDNETADFVLLGFGIIYSVPREFFSVVKM